VGEEGLLMIEKMPEGEVTDEQIAQATAYFQYSKENPIHIE
jgi:transcription initiation factor IIE alpha subunit